MQAFCESFGIKCDALKVADPSTAHLIHKAAANGDERLLSRCLMRGETVHECRSDCSNMTPLHAAILHGRSNAVLFLLSNGADPNATLTIPNSSSPSCLPLTPLHLCCGSDSSECASLLLQKGASSNSRAGDRQETPLLLACRLGARTLATHLVRLSSSSLDATDSTGCCALLMCIERQDMGVAEELLKAGATPPQDLILCVLTVWPGVDLLRLLLRYAIPASSSSSAGASSSSSKQRAGFMRNGYCGSMPYVHHMARSNRIDLLKEVYSSGFNMDCYDADEYGTALMMSIECNRLEASLELIKMGADLTAIHPKTKASPLQMALERNQYEVAAAMLERAAERSSASGFASGSPASLLTRSPVQSLSSRSPPPRYLIEEEDDASPDFPQEEEEIGEDFRPQNSVIRAGQGGAEILLSSKGGVDLLQLIQDSNDEAIELLLAHGLDPNVRYPKPSTFTSPNVAPGPLETSTDERLTVLVFETPQKEPRDRLIRLVMQHPDTVIDLQPEPSYKCILMDAIERHRTCADSIPILMEYLSVDHVTLKDCNGDTPLHYAARAGLPEVTRLILERNDAASKIRNRTGLTPVSVSKSQPGHEHNVAVLRENNWNRLDKFFKSMSIFKS